MQYVLPFLKMIKGMICNEIVTRHNDFRPSWLNEKPFNINCYYERLISLRVRTAKHQISLPEGFDVGIGLFKTCHFRGFLCQPPSSCQFFLTCHALVDPTANFKTWRHLRPLLWHTFNLTIGAICNSKNEGNVKLVSKVISLGEKSIYCALLLIPP